jgi:hypothetical protein
MYTPIYKGRLNNAIVQRIEKRTSPFFNLKDYITFVNSFLGVKGKTNVWTWIPLQKDGGQEYQVWNDKGGMIDFGLKWILLFSI